MNRSETESATPARAAMPVAALGLFQRRSCWVPTPLGWLVVLVILGGLIWFGLARLEPFLSLTEPVPAKVLVVEGWAKDYSLQEAAKEIRAHGYRKILTSGGPMDPGSHLTYFGTTANVAALTLIALGIDSNRVQAVPCEKVRRDRTYVSALAVRSWLEQQTNRTDAINVLTVGSHARRTRLIYERAFGNTVRVGIISVDYDQFSKDPWWQSVSGAESVLSEAIAYVYARLTVWRLRG